ncbi:hypothetical protein EDB89DRAFT_1913474 [Lactarius sanguifluus]|nr:hypothetical protein EDB89DRAFT_1913474 [Lactarius sanguifluus]
MCTQPIRKTGAYEMLRSSKCIDTILGTKTPSACSTGEGYQDFDDNDVFVWSINFHNFDVDDDDSVSKDDDDDDEQIVELSLKNPAKFAEVMATEWPTWKEPGSIDTPHSVKLKSRQSTDSLGSSGSVGGTPTGATPASTPVPRTPGPQAHLTELSDDAGTLPPNRSPTVTPSSPAPTVSHVDTDLVFVEGTTKIMLTSQRPLIRAIVQDAIENLRASMLFCNAFPDVTIAFALSRDTLITATETHGHGGGILISLTRAQFPLFRREVKEWCNTVSVPPIIAIGSAAEITRLIRKQLSGYNYIFPGAPGNMGIARLMRTSQPYRNPRIIAIIHDLYFTCGSTSFLSRFHHLFPTYQGEDGVLYATLYEWHGGAQQIAEFSANAYLDQVLTGAMVALREVQLQQLFRLLISILMNSNEGVLEDRFNNNTHLRPDNLRKFEITVIGNLSEEYLILWQKYR